MAPQPVPRSRIRPRRRRAAGRGGLHEKLRFGPRDERAPVRLQPEPAEIGEAKDVLHGFAPAAPAHEFAQRPELDFADRPLEFDVKAHPREP